MVHIKHVTNINAFMSFNTIGKFTHNVAPEILEKYSEVQLDVLWYLMNLTKVHRIHTKESFREFLIRYLLIIDNPIESKAELFIDDGILIEGVFENTYFNVTVKNLIELICFQASSSIYNIDQSLSEFIQTFSYESPSGSNEENIENDQSISKHRLIFELMGIYTISRIEHLELNFKHKLSHLNIEVISTVNNFVDYVMDLISDVPFEKIYLEHPELLQHRNRYLASDEVKFDVYRLPQEQLRRIMEAIFQETNDYNFLNEVEIISKDVMEENSPPNYIAHITFAVGVKWGFIELSNHPYSLSYCIDPLFDVDFDELLGLDGELFSTQEIYDHWKMKLWEHLLPEREMRIN